ncbi:hypothetical protein NBRC10512_005865 [Rhodotorula toruloides]|uniref:RHTO0S04e07800g1_1 n=2 Tax=Rhodotorula toruloides TaxID=5286 RepID=A0A061AY70_RHOTO|nr:nuclear protein [Rhodotorula toruloides NP11]EMS21221.1 nuclear protein [Rhodotorula toruloides NP11]CDR39683.1 RHTO0S04e07800g1_1 [Rhodotorula toruloides]
MPPQQRKVNYAARKRTATLPAKLRDELEQLGHIAPQKGSGRLGRKDRRKAERSQAKQNKAQHQQGKKRASRDEDEDEAEPRQPVASTSKAAAPAQKADKPAKKKARLAVDQEDEADAKPQKKQTALERLVAKQERGKGPDPARKKSKTETDEDREIAWLEAKLGMGRSLSSSEKGKMREEFDEEGLGELFEGLDDLEGAAFGATKKDYAQLLREKADELDLPSDFDLDDLASGDGGESADDFAGFDAGSADDDDAFGEYGVSDDELRDPSDDDDHEEMGELGSEGSDDDEEMLNESDFEEDDEEINDEEQADDAGEGDERARTVRFADEAETEPMAPQGAEPTPAAPPAPATGRYIPPHLRKAAEAAAAAAASSTPAPPQAKALDAPPEDPRLRRQIQGHLNKLSATNMSAIVDALMSLYSTNPRAVVSTTLTSILLGIISDRDNIGEQLVITYAALVAALFRTVGIEFPAGVVARSVELFDAALKKHVDAAHAPQTAKGGLTDEDGFEGRPGSKECLNLVTFVAELYNFQVVHCGLVYDFVRVFIEGGLGELEVELLSKIIKRCGQQLRSDDPSALKDIISLVKQKMQGVDPASMNSRTRFMVEQLTNLKNNKFKQPGADGAVDNYSQLKKFLVGLNKKRATGSAPEALRVSLSEIRASTTRGKWWLVGAAWSGDPLAKTSTGGATLPVLQTKEAQGDKELAKLARQQGMNTDVRKGIFNVLMSSEDYIDACERLLQLGLSDVQQREIARVLLQCCGNEKTYNPYYTLVAQRLCTKSHSFQITLQYLLWDFLRDLGEKSVGGEELVKSMQDAVDGSGGAGSKVSERRMAHLARLYAWCIAKEALAINILKPVPFNSTLTKTTFFLSQLLIFTLLGTQTPSPAFSLPPSTTRKDRESVERVFVKSASNPRLQKGLGYFFEVHAEEMGEWAGRLGERERTVVKWGIKVAADTLSVGGIVDF